MEIFHSIVDVTTRRTTRFSCNVCLHWFYCCKMTFHCIRSARNDVAMHVCQHRTNASQQQWVTIAFSIFHLRWLGASEITVNSGRSRLFFHCANIFGAEMMSSFIENTLEWFFRFFGRRYNWTHSQTLETVSIHNKENRIFMLTKSSGSVTPPNMENSS